MKKLLWAHKLPLSFALGLLLSASASSAQLGIYGKFDVPHYSDQSSGSAASGWYHGGGVGIYDDFLHLGPVHLGADLRGDFASRDSYHLRSVAGGLRVAGKLPLIPLRPYVEGLVGVGGTQYTGALAAGISGSPYNNKFLYEALGGLDITIFPHLDFRAVEIGVGRQSGTGSGSSAGAATLVLISSGLVLRL